MMNVHKADLLPAAEPQAETAEGDIAIIGMALRVPGARNLDEFWNNLRNGISSIRPVSREELIASGEAFAHIDDPRYVAVTADLPDMEMFDADFFGLSPKEAAIMDPQHRHFLECAWEAIEHGARLPESLPGTTGVFAGCGMGSYFYFNVCSHRELVEQTGLFLLRHTGNDKDFLATRASFIFDLQGPSVNIQTACSTSLVAVHQACQSLLSRECDMALAGGVTIELPHKRGYLFQEGEILSPDGCCRAFDHRAAGTVFGSGVGVVVLRRLSDAMADGDPIQGIIKATAVNNDGQDKAGYLAPSVEGQAKAILEAHALAGIGADTIQYVECHGTGTPIGDPIEIEALTQAFRQSTRQKGFCRVGSVKTNIGHLDTAAGVVGLIKAALCLQQGEIPPSLGYEKPNPNIDFAASPFVVNGSLTPWPPTSFPRRAAVNSLGVGGTNAHVILQEAPARAVHSAGAAVGKPELIVLSAKSGKALEEASLRLANEIERRPELNLDDISHTLLTGRRHFKHRRVLAARDREQAIALLSQPKAKAAYAHIPLDPAEGGVFLFPGGGAQYPGMAGALYAEEPDFRRSVDEGLSYLEPESRSKIRMLWLDAAADDADMVQQFFSPSLQLPAILILEVALARLWMSHGVQPSALIGHSMGENAAACVAGILSFRDTVRLVQLRGELFDTIKGSGMLSVALSESTLSSRLPADLDLASVNAPELCVVSGADDALRQLQSVLEGEEISAARVAINIGAHSRALEPILDRFNAFLRTISLRPPSIPVVSNVSGEWLSAEEACDPDYWTRHLRSTVRFAAGLALLSGSGNRAFIEVGPGKTLTSLAKLQGSIDANAVVNSLPHADDRASDDRVHFLAALGRAWALGLPVEFAGAGSFERKRRLSLPSYPFQHQRFFLDRVEQPASTGSNAPLTRLPVEDWAYRLAWKQSSVALDLDAARETHRWLVFHDGTATGDALVARLKSERHAVATVRLADQFARQDAAAYTLCPEQGRLGYEALIAALKADGMMPDRILHLWLLTADESFRPGSSFFHRNQERGFFSLLYLAQVLGEESLTSPLHVTLVTNGMQRIGNRPLRYPDKATVMGPARVVPQEVPGVTIRMIDVETAAPKPKGLRTRLHDRFRAAPSAKAADKTLDLLWEDLTGEPKTETVAYYDNRRWLKVSEQVVFDEASLEASKFRQRGVYLVTGGLGGLAGAICETLAAQFQARLVLLGRTRLPDRSLWPDYLLRHGSANRIGQAISTITRLEELGGAVLYICADICNKEELHAAVEAGERQFGEINGVLHAAGIVRDNLIPLKTDGDIEAVLAPKLHGTANLAEIFSERPLDMMVLFSSTSVETAPAGQVDYVAGNAYLSAYAASEADRPGRHTVAIHWGIWSEVGLAARAASLSSASGKTLRSEPTTPLFSSWVDEAGEEWLEGIWGPQTHWLLDEHRLRSGAAVWPGTGYLELALQAALEYGLDAPLAIEDLIFIRPLAVADGTERSIRVRLDPSGDRYRVEVRSGNPGDAMADFVLHAEAYLKPLTQGGTVLARPQKTQVAAVPLAEAFPSVQEPHLLFGPRWRVLRDARFAANGAVATLAIDERFQSDFDIGYRIHPALLDIATGYAMQLIDGYDPTEALWVPVSYGRVVVFAPLPANIHSQVRLSTVQEHAAEGFASFDVTIKDQEGNLLVEVERLTVKRLPAGAGLSLELKPERSKQEATPRAGNSKRPMPDLAEHLIHGIRPREGADALLRALATGRSEIIVSSMDINTLCRRVAERHAAPSSATAFERPELSSTFVAPSTDIERTIAGFWSELLGIEKIGINDSFFDLGGHSLLAVRLFRMIRGSFSVDLPISTLFDAPTIAQCAQLIGEKGGRSTTNIPAETGDTKSTRPEDISVPVPKRLHLVAMGGEGAPDRRPLFLCAGMFGNLLNLRHLSLLISADRPVYGLQARGIYGDLPPHETFEEMARDYCAELRTVQPRGPYFLGGFSGGGLAASAMARQLLAAGEEVALLIYLDTPLPMQSPLSTADLVSMKVQDIRRRGPAFFGEWAVRRFKWEAGRLRALFQSGEPLTPPAQFHNTAVEAAFRRALSRFTVQPYQGTVALFRPKLSVAYRLSDGRRLDSNRYLLLEDNGWSRYVRDLNIFVVPGDHDSMVLEPNVRVLAGHLRTLMRKVEDRELRTLFAAE